MAAPQWIKELVEEMIENTEGYIERTYWIRFVGLILCAGLAVFATIFAVRKALFTDIPPTEGYFFLLALTLAAIFLTRSPFRRAGIGFGWAEIKAQRFFNDIASLFLAILVIILWVLSYFFGADAYYPLIINISLIALIVIALFVFLDSSVFGKTVLGFLAFYIVWDGYFFLVEEATQLSFSQVIDIQMHEMFSKQGIYGIAYSAVVDIALLFIFFSAATRLINVNNAFHYLAFRLTHGRRFGFSSALYAICVSAFYGAVSGSARGNITETAKYTMPLMRKAGYRSEFAASVEAIASNSGQLIPPIMGVTAYIIITQYNISYSELALAALLPTLLLIFSLVIAVIVESNRLALRPINLNDKKQFVASRLQTDSEEKSLDIGLAKNSFILVAFALIVFFMLTGYWHLHISLSILVAITILVLGRAIFYPKNPVKYFEFIIDCGKDGLYIIIAAAVTGIMLFVLTETGILVFLTNSFAAFGTFLVILHDYHIGIVAVIFCAALPFAMSMIFPTVATFLVSSALTLPILTAMGFSELHSLLFIFYYASFAGITPPLSPLLDQAAKKAESIPMDSYELEKYIKRLISIALLLPIFWIYHPEILLTNTNIFDWFNDVELIYLIFNFIIAIIAFSVGIFGIKTYNRKEKKEYILLKKTRYWIMILGFICLFPHLLIKIISIAAIITSFIYYDLKLSRSSLLNPTWELLKRIINPKRMPIPLLLTLTILTFVYTIYLAASGFARHFHEDSIQPWLENRFHIVLATEDCQLENDESASQLIEDFLQQKGYQNQTACLQYAPISLTQAGLSDVVISNVEAIEFDTALNQLLPALNTSLEANYQKDIQSYLGNCLTGIEDITDINTVKARNCEEDTIAKFPIVYIGQEMAEIYNLKAGMMVSLYSSTFPEDIPQRLNAAPPHQYVIGGIFETGFAQDIDRLLILPTQTMHRIYSPQDVGQENKLVIKITDLQDIRAIQAIVALLENDIKSQPLREKLFYYLDYAIDNKDDTGELQSGLNTLDAIFFIISIVALVVLLVVSMQVLDSKRKLLALLRVTGIKNEIVWLFILLLSFSAAIVPYLLAIPLSLLLAGLTLLSLENLAYQIDWAAFYKLLAVILLFISITTVFLKSYYFSRSISQELSNDSKHS